MSNITDLSKWLIMQMKDGEYGDGKKLFSKRNHDEMWQLQLLDVLSKLAQGAQAGVGL